MHAHKASCKPVMAAIGAAALACLAAVPFAVTASEVVADDKAVVAFVTMPEPVPQVTLESERRPVPAAVFRALLHDPAIRNPSDLAENAWDFTAPDGVPGFGPLI